MLVLCLVTLLIARCHAGCRQSSIMKPASTAFARTTRTRRLLAELVMVRSMCGIQKVYRLCPGVKVSIPLCHLSCVSVCVPDILIL